jgi:D-serine deaminase-like pyridoxal phosphate-dependent protein
MHIAELPTPCAVVDLDRLERNCERMGGRLRALGVRLRPHVKTHKCAEAARLQVRGHFGGITVSTLAEAHAFAAAGFSDITYAVPIAPARVAAAAELARRVERVTLLLDHEAAAAELEACAAAQGLRFCVLLKVDCGYHRAGVDPQADSSVALAARLAASPYLDLAGVLTHAGHAYHARDAGEIAVVAAQERDVTVAFAEKVRAAGVAVGEVSVGSTPTMCAATELAGITEVRPGNYAFFDAFQAAIGSCTLDDVAFFVLASVIGSYPARGELLLDAGALALSKDEGPRHVRPDCGYGVLLDPLSRRPRRGLALAALSQEHGEVRGEPEAVAAQPIGARVLVAPNHSCLAAALHDRYFVVRGDQVVDEWRPARGW